MRRPRTVMENKNKCIDYIMKSYRRCNSGARSCVNPREKRRVGLMQTTEETPCLMKSRSWNGPEPDHKQITEKDWKEDGVFKVDAPCRSGWKITVKVWLI